MKLNLNFDGFTKLRDWWKMVLGNFEIIQTECNKTRAIADNACTKEEAKAYINEFIGLSDEYMAAIEAFTDLYKENESSVAAMEEVFGERLKYYSKDTLFDANEATGEDAIFFCKAETENTPSNQTGILISKTDNKQMWIEESGEIYYRQLVDDVWSEWVSELNKWQNNLTENVGKTLEQNVEYVNGLIDYLNKSPLTLRRDKSGNYMYVSNSYVNSYDIRHYTPKKSEYYIPLENSGSASVDFSKCGSNQECYNHILPIYEAPIHTSKLSISITLERAYGEGASTTGSEKFNMSNVVLNITNSIGDIVYEIPVVGSITLDSGQTYNNSWSLEIDWKKLPQGEYNFVLLYEYIQTNDASATDANTPVQRKLTVKISTSETYNDRDIIEYPSV